MPFDSRDSFFDAFYDYIFEGVEPDEEDDKWFAAKIEKFFDREEFKTDQNSGGDSSQQTSRRRQRRNSSTNGPRRKRQDQGSSSYGGLWLKS